MKEPGRIEDKTGEDAAAQQRPTELSSPTGTNGGDRFHGENGADGKKLESVKDVLDEVERRKGLSNTEEIKPVGTGDFGPIYDQFKGKPKEAFVFLKEHESGYLKGVFHSDDIGDIDLAWGSAPTNYTGKGLAHIIRKHVEVLGDFGTAQEAFDCITDVIVNGKAYDAGNNTWNIEKGNYRVVIARDKHGNWVLSAFDFRTPKRKKKGSVTPLTPNQIAHAEGAGAVAPNLSSIGKDSKKNNTKQEKGEKKVGEGEVNKEKGAAASQPKERVDSSENNEGDEAVLSKIADYESAIKRRSELLANTSNSKQKSEKAVDEEYYRARKALKDALRAMDPDRLDEIVDGYVDDDGNGGADWYDHGSEAVKKVAREVYFENDDKASLSNAYDDAVDSAKDVKPVAPVKKVSATDFVSKDRNAPRRALKGIYHEDGYIVGCDGRILLAERAKYPAELEGKITDRKGNEIEYQYPDWKKVFLSISKSEPLPLDVDNLHQFVAGVVKTGGKESIVMLSDPEEWFDIGLQRP